jgi:hypothetical protein
MKTEQSETSPRRLQFTLYPEKDTLESIDEAYTHYCRSIQQSSALVMPVSKSGWLLSLIQTGLAQAPGGTI